MTESDRIKLTANQLRALPIFARELDVAKACGEANVSRNSYYQWTKQPAFKAELTRLRDAYLDGAMAVLRTSAAKAASTLVGLTDRDDAPAVQRASANDVLNHLFKYKELQEYDERLKRLEEQVRV